MGGERSVGRGVADPASGEPLERARIVVEPERRTAFVQLAAPERRRGRCPDRPVPDDLLGTEVCTEGDQLREVADRLDGADLLDPDEAVRVEVVAEKERCVLILRSKESRAPVVQEVALVDRLDTEREALLAEEGEDRLPLLLVARAEREGPEGTLLPRIRGNRLPEISRRNRQRPEWSGRSPRRRGRARGTLPRTGWARCRSRARADGGRAPRNARRQRARRRRSCGPGRRS